jgi:hypothetical protein
MIDAAKGARSDDTGGLKMKAVLYIPVNPKKDVCMPPIANEKSKSDRGFNHPMTSRLLCPQKMLHEFDADPRYAININPTSPSWSLTYSCPWLMLAHDSAMRAKFLDGTIKIVANDWPAFLYDESMYDPEEIDKGLLRGYFLLRVWFLMYMNITSHIQEKIPGVSTYLHFTIVRTQGDAGVQCNTFW